jgi:hypothetical protein
MKSHRRELVDPKIKPHRGRIVKTTDDHMLVEFEGPPRRYAVRSTFSAAW